MKLYITKYALTQGILNTECTETTDGWVKAERMPFVVFHYGKDAFTDRQCAIAKAEEMRDKKIKSLEAQIKKLRAMDFRKVKGGKE